jgi:2-polyprenyl-3-methyl-5-hydroxy-6-metoxy-1,4-benzoquinol methylase
VAEFYNRTRRSQSIPLGLLKRGHLMGLPLYYLLNASDLAQEGFKNSGSYAFADHIYRNMPSGRNVLGRWVDARLLSMRAVRSFRNRFLASRDELASFLCLHSGKELSILSVPCGIPRELVDGAAIARQRGAHLHNVKFHGLDLDPEVLCKAALFAEENGLANFYPHEGDALLQSNYPSVADFITSTGLAEFLDDQMLEIFYRIVFETLRPGGGIFISSAMQRRRVSEYLLKIAELHVHYRSAEKLEEVARAAGFQEVNVRHDEFGIQSILVARR